jgi:hypothetical protein
MTIDKTWWPFSDPSMKMHELGHDVWWTKVCDADNNWIGILEWHECEPAQNNTDAGVSAGGVNFENAPAHVKGPRWQLRQKDPLTITPSIHCQTCGLHGFITDGRWVPA